MIILIVIIYLQKSLKPYKDIENNNIDNKALIAGIMVLYTSVLFEDDTHDDYAGFTIFAIIMLSIMNIIFIIEWLYLLLVSCDFKNENLRAFVKLYGLVIWKPKIYNDKLERIKSEEILCPGLEVKKKVRFRRKTSTHFVKKKRQQVQDSFLDLSKVLSDRQHEPSRLKYLDSTISDKAANLDNLITPVEESKTPILPIIQDHSLNMSGFDLFNPNSHSLSPITHEASFKSVLNALIKQKHESSPRSPAKQ